MEVLGRQKTSARMSWVADGPMPPSESELDQRQCRCTRYAPSPRRDATLWFRPMCPVGSGQYGRSELEIAKKVSFVFWVWPRLVSVGGGHAAMWSGAFYKSSRRSKGQFAMKTSFVFPWRAPPMDLPLQFLLTTLLLQSGACPSVSYSGTASWEWKVPCTGRSRHPYRT